MDHPSHAPVSSAYATRWVTLDGAGATASCFVTMEEMVAPDDPCPGCGGTLYRDILRHPDLSGGGEVLPGKVIRCSGGCELVDGIAGVIAAPRIGGLYLVER